MGYLWWVALAAEVTLGGSEPLAPNLLLEVGAQWVQGVGAAAFSSPDVLLGHSSCSCSVITAMGACKGLPWWGQKAEETCHHG